MNSLGMMAIGSNLINGAKRLGSSIVGGIKSKVSGILNSEPAKTAKKTVVKITKPFVDAMTTSAIEAENRATQDLNDFNAEQAELNRVFQQESAQKAMDFEASQAEINRTFQQTSAQKAMDFEAEQNQKAMDFNERMANTQYQRAINDLKAAGLSPLLAYGNLSGSSPTISGVAGQAASGSSASGKSAGGSQASGAKANPSSAKSADLQVLSQILGVVNNGVNSAVSVGKILAGL